MCVCFFFVARFVFSISFILSVALRWGAAARVQEKNMDALTTELVEMLQASSAPLLQAMFPPADGQEGEEDRGMRAKERKSSLSAKFQGQLRSLMTALNLTEPHYIRCSTLSPWPCSPVLMALFCVLLGASNPMTTNQLPSSFRAIATNSSCTLVCLRRWLFESKAFLSDCRTKTSSNGCYAYLIIIHSNCYP